MSILGIKKDGKIVMPGPDYVFRKDEHLMVMGQTETIHALVGKT